MTNGTRSTGLSKTSLLKGMQCPKALYLAKNPPAFEVPPDPDREAKFVLGREVGALAQQLFPGGTEVSFAGSSITEQVAKNQGTDRGRSRGGLRGGVCLRRYFYQGRYPGAYRSKLVADDGLNKIAVSLPTLRIEAEKVRAAQGILEGRRAGLQEGKEKLAEGVCPFFKEQCQNIAGKAPRDVFSARVDELDQESLDLGKRLQELKLNIAAAEKAQQEIDSIKVRAQEVEKQLTGLGQEKRGKRQAQTRY